MACLSVGGSAFAQEGRDHTGFMLRLTGGFGYASFATEIGPVEYKLDGFAGDFSVDVGGAPVENLNIHGRFAAVSVASPSATVEGEDLPTDEDSSLVMMLFGVGVTYYIMPANLYLTGFGGFALGAISYEDASGDQETGATDFGPGVGLDLGWEFWAGRSWGLGPALRFMYISVPDDTDTDDPPVWNGLNLAVLFSGTFQ